MSNYADECLKKYVKLRQTLQKCNMNLLWRTFATVGIDDLIEPNDSEIFFNRPIKRLTRLNFFSFCFSE